MAFVNEYIPTADYTKYDLRRVCGEHNLPRRGQMYSRAWTIDRERDVFLVQVWDHHEAESSGWALFWRSSWIFFELKPLEFRSNHEENSCWARYAVKGFAAPASMENLEEEARSELRNALSAYAGGGVYATCLHRSAAVEFVNDWAR